VALIAAIGERLAELSQDFCELVSGHESIIEGKMRKE
jgi:hypothetical protein